MAGGLIGYTNAFLGTNKSCHSSFPKDNCTICHRNKTKTRNVKEIDENIYENAWSFVQTIDLCHLKQSAEIMIRLLSSKICLDFRIHKNNTYSTMLCRHDHTYTLNKASFALTYSLN